MNDWKSLALPFPRQPRETFKLLELLPRERSLETLLDRVDFEGVEPPDIYFSVLGRPPESLSVLSPQRGPRAMRAAFLAALTSPEFQSRATTLFLNAFAEKRRLIYIHIPKCAGSDFEMHVAPRFLSVAQTLTDPDWIDTSRLIDTLSGMSHMACFFDQIFHYGHINLEQLIIDIGLRGEDRFITIVRDPIDILISQANYVVHRFRTDPYALRPDTKNWLSIMGLDRSPVDLTNIRATELALRVLKEPAIVTANPICSHLGEGRFQRALENLVLRNFEVSDVKLYDRWLAERWGVARSLRYNQSQTILTRDNIGFLMPYLESITDQDRLLYAIINRAFAERDCSHTSGRDLC